MRQERRADEVARCANSVLRVVPLYSRPLGSLRTEKLMSL
jgi:hypothetical protein